MSCIQQFCELQLTKDIINLDSIISNNEFNPRIFCTTSTRIRLGLDSSDVKVIIRYSILENLIHSCQKMGRYGRGRNNDGSRPADLYHLILNMDDHACLFERNFGKIREKNQTFKEMKRCDLHKLNHLK